MKVERKTSCPGHSFTGISSQLAISGLLFLLFFTGRSSFLFCRVEVREHSEGSKNLSRMVPSYPHTGQQNPTFVFFPVKTGLNQKCFLHLLLHKWVFFTMASFMSGVLGRAPVGGSQESGGSIVRVRGAGDAFKCDGTQFHLFLLFSWGGGWGGGGRLWLVWFICLLFHWYHDPSLPASLSGITGSSVHLRPRQPQKLSLSPSVTPRLLFSTEETRSNNCALCPVSLATPVRQTK